VSDRSTSCFVCDRSKDSRAHNNPIDGGRDLIFEPERSNFLSLGRLSIASGRLSCRFKSSRASFRVFFRVFFTLIAVHVVESSFSTGPIFCVLPQGSSTSCKNPNKFQSRKTFLYRNGGWKGELRLVNGNYIVRDA